MRSFRLTEEWQQVKICHETLGSIGASWMLPWNPEILEGTAAEHSKLDMYMALEMKNSRSAICGCSSGIGTWRTC